MPRQVSEVSLGLGLEKVNPAKPEQILLMSGYNLHLVYSAIGDLI